MTLESQFSLFPESDDQMRSALHGFEAVACELADLAGRLRMQLGALPITTVGGAWLVSPLIANAARDVGLAFTPSNVDLALAAARLALELDSDL